MVGLANGRLPTDEARGRKVGTRDVAHEVVDGQVRVVDQGHERVTDLAEVVRRHVRRHAHSDPGGTVHQEIGHTAREDERLLGRVVEVGNEVDGVPVDIGQELLGEGCQPTFGVAVGGRRIPVDRSEVSLPVDQRIADVPLLREPHEGVVHRRVAVGVVALQDLADDAGALRVPAVVE